MEPLLRQLRELPSRFAALSAGVRYGLLAGIGAIAIGIMAFTFVGDGGVYQYAFTNLTPEDASEAAGVLKGSGISFRAEAGGSALAVPANKVHEVRMLLATQGLPRGGGVGFEIFDRGDLGISEFTQKVNLRRAIEGELSRTIGRLSSVRSARVHITLPEKGLYRNEERKATAAVVLNLQPGRSIDGRELAGVRHLVSAAVAGLAPDSVTVVDGGGKVLAGDTSESGKLAGEQRQLEMGMEQRIVDLLEPVVGRGSIVAKVTASMDSREVESTSDAYDPDTAAVRSERKVTEQVNNDQTAGGGVAGAAANQPMGAPGATSGGGSRNQTNREDTLKNYEITKTVTHTLARQPRLLNLSAAVLISGVDGKPRGEAEMRRLGELAKRAVGFDEKRGDRFEISSAAFTSVEAQGTEAPMSVWTRPGAWKVGLAGLAVALLLLGGLGVMLSRRGRGGVRAADRALLRPGSKVGEVEAALGQQQLGPSLQAARLAAMSKANSLGPTPVGADGKPLNDSDLMDQLGDDGSIPGLDAAKRKAAADMVIRARELTEGDPGRAAHLLRAWINMDADVKAAGEAKGG
jgi:flagellar M-ring protein FliF